MTKGIIPFTAEDIDNGEAPYPLRTVFKMLGLTFHGGIPNRLTSVTESVAVGGLTYATQCRSFTYSSQAASAWFRNRYQEQHGEPPKNIPWVDDRNVPGYTLDWVRANFNDWVETLVVTS